MSLQLRNDKSDPGSLQYYGTDASGAKGWHALPENIQDLISLEQRVAALEVIVAQVNVTLLDHEERITALEDYVASDGVVWAITAVDYAVASGINHVKCTASGITITLPTAASVRKIVIKNQTDGVVVVTSASLIDSANTIYLAGREAVQCVADGSTWNIT